MQGKKHTECIMLEYFQNSMFSGIYRKIKSSLYKIISMLANQQSVEEPIQMPIAKLPGAEGMYNPACCVIRKCVYFS